MKKITLMLTLLAVSYGYSQGALPYDFGTVAVPTTHGFIADGIGNTVGNDVDPDDATNSVLTTTGSGENWDNAQVTFTAPIDLSDNDNNVIKFKFKATSGTGVGTHALKFEGGPPGDPQITFNTTDNAWTTIELDFPGGLGTYTKMVIFTDFGDGNTGVGTYLIDDIEITGAPCLSPILSPTEIDFSDPEDSQFIGGDGAVVTFTAAEEMQIQGVGANWDNAQISFCNPTDLSDNDNNSLRFRMRSTTAVAGEVHNHGVSFQPVAGASELNFTTTGQDWIDVELDFPAGLSAYPTMVIFVDNPIFGVGGTNTDTGTYLIDDITLGATVLGVDDFVVSEFIVFPNPSNTIWNVKSTKNINTLQVFDVLGKQVLSLSPNSDTALIDASGLRNGIYFARFNSAEGTKTVKLLKN
ncbi:T9SS type A sorting domain-containing protein [Psychroserpens burtonensis]|uniref:T9SS type A sorting domain-containing protein n=1 Tax=Psychroserpens burtonensis TaxID=49278 RepID=A0A5C7BDJ1_9FLAO|nr:T9SS type A sorting domain-containing protein [Psychroserpens burtonensis]TXE19667.1 T9SS type A sorting domain-containing protein [Psychroserpens burtonensis]